MSDKKVRVRDSKPRDVGLFRKLWKLYLAENEKDHSIVSCTDKSVAATETMFNAYTSKESPGMVLFVGDYAILMAGEIPAPVDYNCGKTVMLWGIFVQADHRRTGVATALVKEARMRLKSDGADTVVTTFTVLNEPAARFALKEKAKAITLTSVISLD
jgi:GNAT superfamily N-acetyltransferase